MPNGPPTYSAFQADDAMRVAIVGLVARFHAPRLASPRTRERPPPGYGVREQCLPFTAATAIGLAILSPITWGYCRRQEAPSGARKFRSPIPSDQVGDDRVFYVVDEPDYGFERNQFAVPPEITRRIGNAPLPGLSFFDRPDQQDLVKLHLPYAWRTAEGVATLFSEPVNRTRADGLRVLSGLVETEWYTNPVNLVLQLPPPPAAVHVSGGDMVAQAILVDNRLRRPDLEILGNHRREARDMLDRLAKWRTAHARDRSAYKHLAKSEHGRLTDSSS